MEFIHSSIQEAFGFSGIWYYRCRHIFIGSSTASCLPSSRARINWDIIFKPIHLTLIYSRRIYIEAWLPQKDCKKNPVKLTLQCNHWENPNLGAAIWCLSWENVYIVYFIHNWSETQFCGQPVHEFIVALLSTILQV